MSYYDVVVPHLDGSMGPFNDPLSALDAYLHPSGSWGKYNLEITKDGKEIPYRVLCHDAQTENPTEFKKIISQEQI